MPAVSDTAFAHHHDATLGQARVMSAASDRAEREAAAAELRHAFCAQLKAARERRGISLHTISEATKVSEGLFADLERCNVARWPTGLYRRSFFREYAALIGMPGEATVSEFLRLFPERDAAATETVDVPGPLRLTLAPPFWRRLSPLHALGAGLDVAFVSLGTGLLTGSGLTGVWTALGTVALAYHLIGTVLLGCSPGTWLVRARGHQKRSRTWLGLLLVLAGTAAPASAQQAEFRPEVGQPGKDVVWVPTPEVMVERMLDLAKVTPKDFVIDLGSGDGRNVIGAAKRGANALGVEYNPDMVALSKRLATQAGVADKAQFVEGDMFAADISKADVMALFLLPSNLLRLRDKFLDLRPGTRLVLNTFGIQDWDADEQVVIDNCEQWCTALLYIVPAKVGGTWRIGSDVLELKQQYQMLSGTLTTGGQSLSVFGQVKGNDISFKAGDRAVTGTVNGNQIDGTVQTGGQSSALRATRNGS